MKSVIFYVVVGVAVIVSVLFACGFPELMAILRCEAEKELKQKPKFTKYSRVINYAPRVMLQIVLSLTDDTRGVIYDRKRFIVEATG